MKILVTGGAGFIASHIVDAYIKQGHQVVVVDNLSSGNEANINPQAKFEKLDITSKQIPQLFANFKPDIVNHHAAQINVRVSVEDPKKDAQTNILGFINLLESAKNSGSVKKVIFASTGGAMYGDIDNLPTPETQPAAPLAPYGISKRSGELYLNFYHKVHGLPYTVLRYSNVYGPRQNAHGEAGVVAIFFKSLLNHQDFTINGDGKQTRDFVYVKDVVNANLLATKAKEIGIFNVATSKETSVNQLVELMNKSLNSSKEIPHRDAISGEILRSCLDYSKVKQTLGWKPGYSLDQGIQETSEYFQQHV